MKIDFLIIGCGLAGINFSELALRDKKSILVIDDNSQQSSTVAGGLYNPVILKRFTPVWKSNEQIHLVNKTYKALENKLNTKLDYKVPIYRVFNSIEEQNNWFSASDNSKLQPYLSNNLEKNSNQSIYAPYGFGVVNSTGRVDTELLITEYRKYLINNNLLRNESFLYDKIQFKVDSIIYKDIEAKHIIFAEGFGIKGNPYFKHLPLKGTKGELFTIQAPELNIDFILKGSVFLIPLGNDLYKVGATYEWEDKTNITTQKGREELISKLKTVISCSFEVIEQHAGIRPTVIDRRPLVGSHKKYKNIHILNGLGTRGVMIAPFVANQLYEYILNEKELDQEINITRF